jgi:hypothetical protein
MWSLQLYPAIFGRAMSQVLFGMLGTVSALAGMHEPWSQSGVKVCHDQNR